MKGEAKAKAEPLDFRSTLYGLGLDERDIEAYRNCTLATVLMRSMRDMSEETVLRARSILRGTAEGIGTTIENVKHFYLGNLLIMLDRSHLNETDITSTLSPEGALAYVKQCIESALLEETCTITFNEDGRLLDLFQGNRYRFHGLVMRLEHMFGREICEKRVLDKLFTKTAGFLIRSLTEFAAVLQNRGEKIIVR